MIRIKTNVASFNERLKAKAVEVQEALVGTINRWTARFVTNVSRGNSPASASHRKKGWLGNSVRPIPATEQGGSIVGGVEAGGGDAWYGRLFEDGTFIPYEISAANKKFLRFELGGEVLFRKTVQHPPFNPMKLAFMRPLAQQMKPELEQSVLDTVIEVLNA